MMCVFMTGWDENVISQLSDIQKYPPSCAPLKTRVCNSLCIPIIGLIGWMTAVPPTLVSSHSPTGAQIIATVTATIAVTPLAQLLWSRVGIKITVFVFDNVTSEVAK